MKIYVDADACPKVIKEIILRAAERTETPCVFIANSWLRLPVSPFISFKQSASNMDAADDDIVALVQANDLVITADIPLAARSIEKGALALSPRGDMFDEQNIQGIRAMRDFMDTLRGSGIDTGGPSALAAKDREAFANQLDRLITRSKKS